MRTNHLFYLTLFLSFVPQIVIAAGTDPHEKDEAVVEFLGNWPPQNKNEELHFREAWGDERFDKKIEAEKFFKNLTKEDKEKIIQEHKKSIVSKYIDETPIIKERRKLMIEQILAVEDFIEIDPINNRDPCEDRKIKKKGYLVGFNPELDKLCKEMFQIIHEVQGRRSKPSLISFSLQGGYTISYHDTQIDFSTLYISKNDNGYVGIYMGNHSGFPLEKLDPENEIKESKVENKTVIEEYTGNRLVRKQVRIETGNDYPAEITAWTNGTLKGHELDEALGILDSLDRKLFNENVESIEDQ